MSLTYGYETTTAVPGAWFEDDGELSDTASIIQDVLLNLSISGAYTEDEALDLIFANQTSIRKPPEEGDEDVVIAVMGATGAGKSTFIQLATDRDDVRVGDTLSSETAEVCAYEFFHDGINYILVDTPGFEDTDRPDSEITESILTWLRDSMLSGQRLNGIIYLHRIINPRMGGTALRNNRMFRRLVGEDAFKNVILATTFWEQVDTRTALKREAELRDTRDFWGSMVENGARMERLMNDRASALSLIKQISAQDKVVFQAQDEIVNQGKSVSDAAAARELREEAERVERELAAAREAEKKRIEEQLEAERRRRIAEVEAQRVKMEKALAAKREAARLQKARQEREARELYERERKRLEEERRQAAEQRRRDIEEMERKRQEEIKQEEQRKVELRQKFQQEYICIGFKARWPCDGCNGNVFKYTIYYHCCFCHGDRYFRCGNCGNDCGDPDHPWMRERATPDDCVVM